MMDVDFCPIFKNLNLNKIPVNKVDLETYNYYVKKYNERYELGEINRGFVRTPSGGLSISKHNKRNNISCYEVWKSNAMFELVVVDYDGCIRLQYWIAQPKNIKKEISGRTAFKKLKQELKRDGVDITNYYIENGKEVKETIAKPLIKMQRNSFIDKTFEHCYHFDINSAYPHAMRKLYPEWSTTLERIYSKRKENNSYKDILTHSYGYFQSKYLGYKLAHVSKFCNQFTIDYLNKATEMLEKKDCVIIAYNTDGIWYQDVEGKTKDLCIDGLGGFKIDHKDCKLRFKSSGCYEFIEGGKYTPVVRGFTNLDYLKTRDNWEWGDIYKAIPKMFRESEDEYGIIEEVNYNG